MKRTGAIAIAATVAGALTVSGAGAMAYAQTTTTTTPAKRADRAATRADLAAAAATALGMTTDELKDALKGGQTIEQIAQSKGVSIDTVKQALTDAVNAAIDKAVTDGKLTADQATKAKEKTAERVSNFVEYGPKRGGGRGGPGGAGLNKLADPFKVAADTLGMTEDELKTALQGGKTIAQVAQEKGKTADAVVTALVDAANKAIDQAVTDGKLTADQATQAKAKAAERAADIVNNPPPARGERPGKGAGRAARFGAPLKVAADTLGMTEDELRTALQGGKTIAQVAQEKGKTADAVVTALVDAANKAIDQAVTDGKLTADQATQAKAKAAEHAANIVNNPPPARGERRGR
ncbi:MAG: hypothetical protein ACOYN3_03515 [Acidimicrobiia bacterium]